MKMRIWVVGLLFWAQSVCADTFEVALAHYQSGEFQQAYTFFNQLAALGNCRAQFNIAVMHLRGEHVEKDLSRALAWGRLAEANGCAETQALQKFAASRLDAQDQSRADQEFANLDKTMGALVMQQHYLPTHLEKAQVNVRSSRPSNMVLPEYPSNLIRRGTMGWVDVQFVLGKDGTARHYKILMASSPGFDKVALDALARSSWEPAQVDGVSVNGFGEKNRYVFRIAGSALEAEELQSFLDDLQQKAEEGGSNEKLAFAVSLSGIRSAVGQIKGGENMVWEDATAWYAKAAQDGSALAQYHIGLATLSGEQCDLSYDKSLFWLNLAAQRNVLDARFALGYELLSGRRFKQDTEGGWQLLRSAADQGLPEARVVAAWLLATFPDARYRNAGLAGEYLAGVDLDRYADLRSYTEAAVAVALAREDWSGAEKSLRQLTRINKRYKTARDRELALAEALARKGLYAESL